MWNMTSFGILMPSIRPAETIEAGDDRRLQVRTRRAKDLDILREKYLPALGETIATPEMDYNFRAYCTHEQYAEAMRLMILDIDYAKFKPTTEDKYQDKDLHSVYNAIWGTVCRLGAPGGAWANWGNYRETGTRATTTRTTTSWGQPTLAERFAATEAEVWEEPETATSRRRGRSRWVPNRGARKARRQHLDFEEGRASGYDEGYNDGWEDGYDYRDREARHTPPATETTDDVRDGDALWRDINEAVLADLAAANIDTAHLDAIRDEAESFEAERNAEIARRRGALFFSGDSRIGGPL